MICGTCGHDESEHETVEYRGDKSRSCLTCKREGRVPRCMHFTPGHVKEVVTTYERRQKEKADATLARNIARNWLEDYEGSTVSEHAHTHPTETGYFVEAQIWVPNEAMEYHKPQAPRTDFDSGLCCMARHANAVPPWTCDCPCHKEKK